MSPTNGTSEKHFGQGIVNIFVNFPTCPAFLLSYSLTPLLVAPQIPDKRDKGNNVKDFHYSILNPDGTRIKKTPRGPYLTLR